MLFPSTRDLLQATTACKQGFIQGSLYFKKSKIKYKGAETFFMIFGKIRRKKKIYMFISIFEVFPAL